MWSRRWKSIHFTKWVVEIRLGCHFKRKAKNQPDCWQWELMGIQPYVSARVCVCSKELRCGIIVKQRNITKHFWPFRPFASHQIHYMNPPAPYHPRDAPWFEFSHVLRFPLCNPQNLRSGLLWQSNRQAAVGRFDKGGGNFKVPSQTQHQPFMSKTNSSIETKIT